MANETASSTSIAAASKEQLAKKIKELTEQLQQARQQNAQLQEQHRPVTHEDMSSLFQTVVQSTADTVAEARKPKVHFPGPEKFDGSCIKLWSFLMYMRAYHDHYGITNAATKVTSIVGFLVGDAVAWFEPTLQDYYTSEPA